MKIMKTLIPGIILAMSLSSTLQAAGFVSVTTLNYGDKVSLYNVITDKWVTKNGNDLDIGEQVEATKFNFIQKEDSTKTAASHTKDGYLQSSQDTKRYFTYDSKNEEFKLKKKYQINKNPGRFWDLIMIEKDFYDDPNQAAIYVSTRDPIYNEPQYKFVIALTKLQLWNARIANFTKDFKIYKH